MCIPVIVAAVGGTANMLTGLTIALSAASMAMQHSAAKAQMAATDQQNQLQADQISDKAGVEMSARASEARQERATARVLASESGINLGSGSFLAQLQNSAQHQYNDMGLISRNEKSAQANRTSQANSIFAGIHDVGAAEAGLTIAAAGFGAYNSGRAAYDQGAASAGVTGAPRATTRPPGG